MTIDPYSPCPGGTGKKIKFCCADLVAEHDKIQRMLDGDQRTACLDYIAKLETKHPQRACLLAIRSLLETSLDKREAADATLTTFREKFPGNPVALAQTAVWLATGDHPLEAIDPLLRAIEASSEEMSPSVYEAIGMVGMALLEHEEILPARALLELQFQISRGEDQTPLRGLLAIHADPGISLLLKEGHDFEPAPDGVAWKFEFDVALERARRQHWQAATDKFAALIPLAGQSPALWHNLALLRGWLGDYGLMIEALEKYAALDVPLDDAVEAETLALSCSRTKAAVEDELFVTYAGKNQAALDDRFAAERNMTPLPVNPAQWRANSENEAPPRSIHMLLDRPVVRKAEGLARGQIPRILGYVLLFGRQTDRPERVILQIYRSELSPAETALKRIAGDALGEPIGEPEIVNQRFILEKITVPRWRVPDDTPIDQRQAWHAEELREQLFTAWPRLPQAQLGGQSLEQLAADRTRRARALAAILSMELVTGDILSAETFNELRQRFGLPTSDPIDPTGLDVAKVHLPRLARLQVEKLSDEQLLKVYQRSVAISFRRAIAKLGAEVVRRPETANKLDHAAVHGNLAALAATTAEAIKHLDRARAAAQKSRRTTAPWDLQELRLRVATGEPREAARLIEHLIKEHGKETEAMESLAQLMGQMGLIDAEGRMLIPRFDEPSPILVPGGAEGSKILTPGGEPAAAGQRPAIWMPGME